jgi:hypothetical protein
MASFAGKFWVVRPVLQCLLVIEGSALYGVFGCWLVSLLQQAHVIHLFLASAHLLYIVLQP